MVKRIFVVISVLCFWMVQAESDNQNVRTNAQVVVTASRVETLLKTMPEVIHVITRKDIEQIMPMKTGELVEHANGTSVATGTGSGYPKRSVISLNGLPPKYTMVLVDGVPLLSEHIHTGQNIELVPAESIERIEIMRGSASAMYGSDSIGGVVNIITHKKVDQPELDVMISAGNNDTYQAGITYCAPIGTNAQISSSVEWEKSDGVPIQLPAHRVDLTGYERVAFFNRIDVDLSDDTHVYMSFNGYAGEMEWGRDPNPAYSRLLVPSVGLEQQLTDSLFFSGRVSYSDWRADLSGEHNKLTKPDWFFRWNANDQHTVTVGGEYRYNTFERTAIGNISAQHAYGAYIQDEWMMTEKLFLTGALRYDKTEGINSAVSPKLALLWLPSDEVSVRASAGRGFHAPTLQELYEQGYGHDGVHYRYGNPDLDPEYSTSCMLGVEVNPTDRLQFMVNGFYTEFEDMIIPVYRGVNALGQIWQRENVHEAKVYGVDTGCKYQISDPLSVDAGVTWSESQNKDTGREIPYHSGITAHARLVWVDQIKDKDYHVFIGARGGFKRTSWNWNPGTAAVTSSGLTTGMDDFVTLDAGCSVEITDRMAWFFKIENILGEDIENLDDSYTVLEGEPLFRFGLKYSFLP